MKNKYLQLVSPSQDSNKLQHLDLTKSLMWIATWFNLIYGAPNTACQLYSFSFVYLWLPKFGPAPGICARRPASNQITVRLSDSQQKAVARCSTGGISAIGRTCGCTGMWAICAMSLQRAPESSHQHLLTFLCCETLNWALTSGDM